MNFYKWNVSRAYWINIYDWLNWTCFHECFMLFGERVCVFECEQWRKQWMTHTMLNSKSRWYTQRLHEPRNRPCSKGHWHVPWKYFHFFFGFCNSFRSTIALLLVHSLNTYLIQWKLKENREKEIFDLIDRTHYWFIVNVFGFFPYLELCYDRASIRLLSQATSF